MSTRQEQMEAFGRFLDILDELREKCPWDRKQTNESLRPNTIEEVYELCDALINDDDTNICKELGDVLHLRHKRCVCPPVREAHLPSPPRVPKSGK